MLRAPHLWMILLVLVVITVAGGAYALTLREDDGPADTIVVELRTGDGAMPVVKKFSCGDDGMAAVCAALTPSLLQPVPKDKPCTMVYGGPQTATVVGTLRGSAVGADFSRINGCEIARWSELANALKPLQIDGLDP